jgi:hypothetical protein
VKEQMVWGFSDRVGRRLHLGTVAEH